MKDKQLLGDYLGLAECFHNDLNNLKSNIYEAACGAESKLLMVTSSKPGEGKTLASICMAKTLAEEGSVKVLLLDVNIKEPILHKVFNTPREPGLSEMVLDNATIEQTCRPTAIPNVDVLSTGSLQANTSWMFDSNQFAGSLQALSQHYDYIIADTHSFLSTSEVSLVCPLFDAILLVVECENTKWQVAKITAEKISKAGGKLLGTVMNRRKFYIPRFFYG